MEYKRKEQIGPHTLYLGDCMEVMPTLGRFDAVVTDPPYEASLHASKNSLRGRVRVDCGPALRGLDFAPIDEIRERFISITEECCSGWLLAFCTIEGIAKWADAINVSSIRYKRACVWIKPDSTPQLNGQGPAQGVECFVSAWCGRGHAKWNAGGKRGVYTHCTNHRDRHGTHPTEKPVPLMRELIADFTAPNTTILDPFMGSGTTGVACQKLGRVFTGIELDESYFDIACRRIEEAMRQPDLFVETTQKPEQLTIGLEEAE